MPPASPASLPSTAVAGASKLLRGKRSGVAFAKKGTVASKDGIEAMDEFWTAAKTPEREVAKPVKKSSAAAKPTAIKQPRFSLPGVGAEIPNGESAVNKYLDKALSIDDTTVWSPGDLSRVSTLPPSPASPMPTPEAVRAAVDEEEEVALPQRMSVMESPGIMSPPQEDFSMENNHDDDDDDDMIPPPPPQDDEDIEEIQETQDSSPTDLIDFPNHEDKDADTFDDKDDDDKEGPGFHMVEEDQEIPESPREAPVVETQEDEEPVVPADDDDETEDEEETKAPEKKKRGRPKKVSDTDSVSSRPKKRKDSDSVASTPALKRTKGKQNKKVYWSPVGYQAGPREFKPVPISDYKDSPDAHGRRRSRRAKIPPLQFWKNERVEFGAHDEQGDLGDAMGCMPTATAVLQALPTPYKKRKVPAGGGFGAKNRSSSRNGEVPFNSNKLKKMLGGVIEGEDAHIWDEGIEDARDQKVVSYASKSSTATDLPLALSRKKSEGKVVGKASQSFNIPSDINDQYVGYIMGSLILPPQGIKDPESTGPCSQVFTVCNCQPGSLEIAYSDPHEEEGTLNPETALRFLLGPGDQFRVPPGNSYRLQNHSKSTDCLLAWTIIRPRRVMQSP